MPVRKLTKDDVTFSIIESECDLTPAENYGESGPEADAFIKSVEKAMKQHGIWGWCDVEVEARFMGLEASSYLSGCSYKDREDFKKCDYYEQMCDEALADIQIQAENLYNALHAG